MTTEPAPQLPPLPEPCYPVGNGSVLIAYSRAQMREYATAAVLADRSRLASSLAAPASDPQPTVDNMANSFFVHIAHGDEDHRAWLKRETYKWFRSRANLIVAAATTSPTESGLASKAIASPASPTPTPANVVMQQIEAGRAAFAAGVPRETGEATESDGWLIGWDEAALDKGKQ